MSKKYGSATGPIEASMCWLDLVRFSDDDRQLLQEVNAILFFAPGMRPEYRDHIAWLRGRLEGLAGRPPASDDLWLQPELDDLGRGA